MIIPSIPFVQGKNNYTDSDGIKYGIAVHNTSNNASDSGEASYGTWRPDGTSSHLYADADSVTQSLDTDRKAGHAGSPPGNENAVSVEITGTNDKTRDWWLANVAWDKLGAVLAAVIRYHWPDGSFQVRRATVAEMKANPKVKALYSHDDMRLAWGGTTHDDPGPNFPWDRLFTAINDALGTYGGRTVAKEEDMHWFAKADREGYPADKLWFGDKTSSRLVPATEVGVQYQTSVVEKRGGLFLNTSGKPDIRGNRDGMGPVAAVATVDAKALAAELVALGVSGATVEQVEAAVTRVLTDTRFTPAPK